MSDLDRIEREAKERRDSGWSYKGRGGWDAESLRRKEAEADVDQLLAIARRNAELTKLTPQELEAVREGSSFYEVVQERDKALAEVKELRKDVDDARRGEREAEEAEVKALAAARALLAEVEWWEEEHGCCRGHAKEVLAEHAWVEEA